MKDLSGDGSCPTRSTQSVEAGDRLVLHANMHDFFFMELLRQNGLLTLTRTGGQLRASLPASGIGEAIVGRTHATATGRCATQLTARYGMHVWPFTGTTKNISGYWRLSATVR